jgi:2-polyprenyl-6-methoxyphenol hydroxylase-like FAD-dependent oxidoreductase
MAQTLADPRIFNHANDTFKQTIDTAILLGEAGRMTNEVMIIGAGIGGLCLAQGLRKAGVPVTVYERNAQRTDWLQGYRIHLNPRGSRALHDHLPPAAWQHFLRAVYDGDGGFGFVTEQLRPLLDVDAELVNGGSADPAGQHHGVSRISLREVLLTGLDGVVEYGRVFERYELTAGGRVRAHFADGSTAEADLLVGADGANSRVRGQLLPHAAGRVDTGVIAVGGKYILTPASSARLPELLTGRTNSVLPVGPGSLFTSVWRGDRAGVPAVAGAGRDAGALFDNTTDYTLWGYADAAVRMPAPGGPAASDGAALRDEVLARLDGWSPALRQLIAGSHPDTLNLLRIRSAVPVDGMPAGPVTLLGDAIHNMTPMAGIGANTALRDAHLLGRRLVAAHRGRLPLAEAVGGYQREMLDYGFAAVRLSLRNARQAGSANPVARRAFRAFLRTANALPPVKRRMFAGLGS